MLLQPAASTQLSSSLSFDVFAHINLPAASTSRSELDDYLTTSVENVVDPLKWWWEKRRVFPKLSRMALDFLSIPGSVSVIFF